MKLAKSRKYEFGSMFLLRVGILIGVMSVLGLVRESSAVDNTQFGWDSKPVIVNVQIDLENEEEQQEVYNILDVIEDHNGHATVFVTGGFASMHSDIVRSIEARGHQIAVHGWQSGEDLTLLSPDEQFMVIQTSFSAVRSAVDKPEDVVDFKPQGYKFNFDTIRILQEFGARSISGLFPCAELICQCWYAQSLGKITFPYPITNEFWAVPISEITIDPNDVPLDDAYFGSGADYFNYVMQKYIQQTETKDPLVIVLHPGTTGADEGGLGALSTFLDFVKGDNAKIAALDSICHFTTYISNFNASGPSQASVTETVTIGVTYTSNVYCPHYRFRAYGKYPGQEWKLLDSHCEFVYTGNHAFSLQATIPAPPGNENTYTIKVVGRGSFGSCALSDPDWPTYNSYEVHKDLTISVVKPVKIEDIIVTGIPDASNPMTNDPSIAGPEQVQLEAEMIIASGYEVTEVSWSGDIVPGEDNPYKYVAGKGTHGNKSVTCTISYRNTTTGATGTDTKTKEFELFFRKTGHEDGRRKPPNWYKYWSMSDNAACSYDRTTVTYRYGGGSYDGNDWGAYNGSVNNPVYTIYNRATMDGSPLSHAPAGISIDQRGIDCVEVVLRHEREHREVDARWLPGGAWHTAYGPRTTGPGGNDRDDDELPNEVEDSIDGFDPDDKYSFPCFFNSMPWPLCLIFGSGQDDEEVYNTRIAQHQHGVRSNDWANPGKRSDPEYLRIITETGTSATLTDTYTDYGTDIDGDGSYDNLSIEVGVDVATAGTYRIFGNLYDGAGNMLWAENSLFLDVGGQSVILSFDGLSIRQGRVNGPYYLGPLTLFGKDITDEREVAYTTSAYSYTDFERPLVEFKGNYSDYGTDTDGDGLYNYLAVEVGVDAEVSGDYIIEGGLYDSQGKAIEIAFTTTYLDVGSQLVTLNFAGLLINRNQVDGPYYLRYLSLSGSGQVDFVLDAYTSSVYSSGDFETAELPQTGITGTVTDYDGFPVSNAFIQVGGAEEDSTFTDANGHYVLLGLQPGSYAISVTPEPYDNLMLASGSASLSAGEIVTRNFVLNPAGSIGGEVTDSNGDPVPNVTLYLSGYETPHFATNDEGEYIIPGLSAGTHTINIDAPGHGPWYVLVNGTYISEYAQFYSTTVQVTLSQTTWVDFTHQPPPEPNIWVEPNSLEITMSSGKTIDKILTIGNDGNDVLEFDITQARLYFCDNIESGENGWTYSGLWHITEHRSQSPTHAWYYGIEGQWNYDTGGTNSGSLTTPPIVLTDAQNLTFTFWRWEETEGGDYYDYRHVYVSTNNGATWNNIYVSQGLNQREWVKETIDLSGYAGNIVLIRFQFDTIDSLYNDYEGWYVDDVIVSGGGTIDWLSESPTTGSVNPGEQTEITVTIDTTGLELGEYTGYIVVNSNDLDEGVIYIPVALTVANFPPVADAGPDQTVEQESYDGTEVTLDGSGSTDPDSTPGTNDDIVSFDWYEGDTLLGSGETINYTFPLGTHTVTLVVTDSYGETDSDEVIIVVEDTTPPEFMLSVTPDMLWPANHKMVKIKPSWEVSDNCDESPEVTLVSISSNEDDDSKGDGHTSDDIQVSANGSIYLRAERSGKGSGRVYTITYQAVDDSGNVVVDSATVTVPHDKRRAK